MPQAGRGAPTCVCAVPYCSVCAVLHRCVLHCTMCAVLHRIVLRTTLHRMCCAARHCSAPCAPCHTALCVVPHYTVLSPTPVSRARQHRVEGTVGLVHAQPTSAPSPLEGRWRCRTTCTQAATHVLQPL